MSGSAGIAGAGLIGRLLALAMARAGWRVSLFDQDDGSGAGSAGWVAAGMLAPYAELDTAEPLVFRLGRRSVALWQALLPALARPVYFQRRGTMLVAHRQDMPEMDRFLGRIQARLGERCRVEPLDRQGLARLEPALAERFHRGAYLPEEGQVSPQELYPALAETLALNGVIRSNGARVEAVAPGGLRIDGRIRQFDWACDARGMGAKAEVPRLRGVRGEILTVHAPEVRLTRLVRLMHPRYALYIVPRPGGRFVIGATSIESEDTSPISVQSALELLSAAYSVHHGFAEARLLGTATQLRPALPDHLPRIFHRPGLIRINGLYRHGYLLGPAVVGDALRLIESGPQAMRFPALASEEPDADDSCERRATAAQPAG